MVKVFLENKSPTVRTPGPSLGSVRHSFFYFLSKKSRKLGTGTGRSPSDDVEEGRGDGDLAVARPVAANEEPVVRAPEVLGVSRASRSGDANSSSDTE